MGHPFSKLRNAARLLVFALVAFTSLLSVARAADLPLATGSGLAGIGFDDRPLQLPVQRNFQMAMLTAGSELGRSCGKMEAFGWRMNQSEQGRVDQIFNSTVDRLRGLGYVVELQTPNSISHDITMFTADRPNRHLLAMWSAGEIGLVMVLCETGSPTPTHTSTGVPVWPSVKGFPQDVMQSKLDAPVHTTTRKLSAEKFSPTGSWVGSYICAQGYTGATLTIGKLHGDSFEGAFHFYPTAKNPTVPEGRYTVYGQYDRESQRILINPGKWTQRPRNFYNTVIVGNFDPMEHSLSAYFQGINGCTSFEARNDKQAHEIAAKAKRRPAKKAKKKSTGITPVVIEAPVATGSSAPAAAPVPASTMAPPAAAPGAAMQQLATPPSMAPPASDKPPLVVGEPTPGTVPTSTAAPAAK